MAIYGIGAYYGEDVSDKFISRGLACVGWDEKEAPDLYAMLESIKAGDVIYIKSYPPGQGLFIKAVGIVMDEDIEADKPPTDLGWGRHMRWVWTGEERIAVDGKNNTRSNTLYEEFHPKVRDRVLELLLSRLGS